MKLNEILDEKFYGEVRYHFLQHFQHNDCPRLGGQLNNVVLHIRALEEALAKHGYEIQLKDKDDD